MRIGAVGGPSPIRSYIKESLQRNRFKQGCPSFAYMDGKPYCLRYSSTTGRRELNENFNCLQHCERFAKNKNL